VKAQRIIIFFAANLALVTVVFADSGADGAVSCPVRRPVNMAAAYSVGFNYTDANALKNPQNDADFFRSKVENAGISANVLTDRDLKGMDDPKDRKTHFLNGIGRAARGKMDFLFSFSGHGITDENGRWLGFLPPPAGANLNNCFSVKTSEIGNSLVVEGPGEFRFNSRSIINVLGRFKTANGKEHPCSDLFFSLKDVREKLGRDTNLLAFLDSCHSGAVLDGLDRSALGNTVVLSASRANEVAADGKGSNGEFTELFKLASENPLSDTNKDGFINIGELVKAVESDAILAGENQNRMRMSVLLKSLRPRRSLKPGADDEVIPGIPKEQMSYKQHREYFTSRNKALPQVPVVNACGDPSPLMNINIGSVAGDTPEAEAAAPTLSH